MLGSPKLLESQNVVGLAPSRTLEWMVSSIRCFARYSVHYQTARNDFVDLLQKSYFVVRRVWTREAVLPCGASQQEAQGTTVLAASSLGRPGCPLLREIEFRQGARASHEVLFLGICERNMSVAGAHVEFRQ